MFEVKNLQKKKKYLKLCEKCLKIQEFLKYFNEFKDFLLKF